MCSQIWVCSGENRALCSAFVVPRNLGPFVQFVSVKFMSGLSHENPMNTDVPRDDSLLETLVQLEKPWLLLQLLGFYTPSLICSAERLDFSLGKHTFMVEPHVLLPEANLFCLPSPLTFYCCMYNPSVSQKTYFLKAPCVQPRSSSLLQ